MEDLIGKSDFGKHKERKGIILEERKRQWILPFLVI
jgi:hypothetical protein